MHGGYPWCWSCRLTSIYSPSNAYRSLPKKHLFFLLCSWQYMCFYTLYKYTFSMYKIMLRNPFNVFSSEYKDWKWTFSMWDFQSFWLCVLMLNMQNIFAYYTIMKECIMFLRNSPLFWCFIGSFWWKIVFLVNF